MKPAISIIVPIYNVEDYLSACIDSVLAQTFSDFELILINDGSTDSSGDICDRYGELDSRITVIHKSNSGVSSARNKGLEVSIGNYIAFVDPDDSINCNMYEVLFESAIKHNADIVVCPIKKIDTVNNKTSISRIWKMDNVSLNKDVIDNYIIPEILQIRDYSLISCVNKLYKKSVLDCFDIRFDEHKSHGEDVRFNFQLLTLVGNIVYVKQPLYNYFLYKRDSLTQIFREDLYDHVLDNKNFLIGISKKYNMEIHINKIRNHFSHVTLSYINEVVNSTLTKKEKYEILFLILKDKEFYEDILKYRSPTIYYRALKLMCLLNNEKLLYGFVKAKNKFQYYTNKNKRYLVDN